MKPETIQLLKNLGYGLSVLSVVAGLVWGTWHLVRLPSMQIESVMVAGGETISHDALADEVSTMLEGLYWEFIPRSFVFTYPKQEIIDRLNETPRVKNPTVHRDGQSLRVELAEFEPVALWCDSSFATSTPCVFLDENGYGFAQAPMLAGGSYTRFTLVGEEAVVSQVYTDSTDFSLLRELEDLLFAKGWTVARVELDQARDAFIYLVGESELKTTLRQTPQQTFDNLQAVLQAEQYQDLTPGSFEYIDLRFGNKVFVNEFGVPEEEIQPELENATTSVASEDEA